MDCIRHQPLLGMNGLFRVPGVDPTSLYRWDIFADNRREQPRRSPVASSNGPMTASVGGRRAGRRRRSCTSSTVTASIRLERLVDAQQRPRGPARPCRAGSSATRCPPGRAPARRAAGPCRARARPAVIPSRATRASSLAHEREHLVDLARACSRRRRRRRRCRRSCGGERVDRVGQAALLADLLEQPAAHAAAEHRVEHAEREPPVVVAATARARRARRWPARWRRTHARRRAGAAASAQPPVRGGGRAAGVVVEQPAAARSALRTSAHAGRVVDVAGGRDDHVLGPVVRGGSSPDRRAGQRLDRSRRCRRIGRPSGVSPNSASANSLVHEVGRVVVAHRDLFEDHAALAVDVVGAGAAREVTMSPTTSTASGRSASSTRA